MRKILLVSAPPPLTHSLTHSPPLPSSPVPYPVCGIHFVSSPHSKHFVSHISPSGDFMVLQLPTEADSLQACVNDLRTAMSTPVFSLTVDSNIGAFLVISLPTALLSPTRLLSLLPPLPPITIFPSLFYPLSLSTPVNLFLLSLVFLVSPSFRSAPTPPLPPSKARVAFYHLSAPSNL